MDLLPTPEQQQIIDSAAAFLSDRLPLRRHHAKSPPSEMMDSAAWREIADLGWLGMTIPEEFGGVGYTLVEEMLAFREMGRVVAPLRLLTTAIAAKVAVAAGNRELTVRIASGHAQAAYAINDDFGAKTPSLANRRFYEVADSDLALTIDGDWCRLFDISRHDFKPRSCLDKSVSMALASLEGAPLLATVQSPAIRQEASVLAAAMLVGQAELARDMINEYAKIRYTFGRPIGAYQAVRHPIAEMAVRCDEAKSQLFVGAIIVGRQGSDADVQASITKVLAAHAAEKNADDNIQLHGGIGVADEFDAHLLIKRVHVLNDWFEGSRSHLQRILHAPLNPY